MQFPMAKVVAAACLGALALASCGSEAQAPTPPGPTPTAAGPTAAAPSPAGPGAAAASAGPSSTPVTGVITWRHTGLNREVGVMRVPLDHDRPDGEQITLALARQSARVPAERVGAVILLPGGPGGSGLGWLRDSSETLLPAAVLDRFDVVALDARGLGQSVPRLECALTHSPQTWDASDPGALGRWMAILQEEVDACAATAGPLLAHVGSIDTARDVETLREALGEDRISLLAQSYGTIVAQVYAERFPDHLRAAVLDAPVDLAQDAEDAGLDMLAALQRAFDGFLAACAADAACPFWSSGDPRAAYDGLAARLARQPMGELTLGRLPELVVWGLLSPDRSQLADGLAAAVRGDPGPLVALGSLGASTDRGYSMAVNSLDFGGIDLASVLAEGGEAEVIGPDFAGVPTFGLARAIWPVTPTELVTGDTGLDGVPPLLVVGATGDPSTPYTGARSLAQRVPGSVLVTLEASQHGATGGQNACVDEVVAAYLLDPGAPRADVTCAPETSPGG